MVPTLQEMADYAALQEVRSLRRIVDAPETGRQGKSDGRRVPNPLAGPPEDRNFPHVTCLAPTGGGKGELIKKLTKQLNELYHKPALFLLDGDGKLALDMAVLHMDRIKAGTAVYDEVRLTSKGIGLGFPQPSTHPDRQVAEAENRENTAFLKAVTASLQGEMDLSKTVMVDEVGDDVGSLIFDKVGTAGIMDLLTAFMFKSKQYQALQAACWNELTKQKWIEAETMPFMKANEKIVPFRRRIEKLLRCVQLRNRSVATIDLAGFLNKGGWYFAGAGSENDLGREDASKLFKMLLWTLLNLVWNKKLKRKLIVIIDEGVGLKLIDATVARALAELRKYGVQFVLLIQDPFSLDEPILKAVMDNCKFKYIFAYQEPEAAAYFARMLAIRKLGIETKYTTQSTRRVIDRYDEIRTFGESVTKDPVSGGKRTTETKGTHFQPVYVDVTESQAHPYQFEELILLEQKELMGMKVGQFKVSSTDYVSSGIETFEMVEMPCDGLFYPGPPRMPLAEYKLRKLLKTLYETNPVYRLARVEYPTWEPIKDQKNGKQNGQPKNGNGQTPMRKNAAKNSGNYLNRIPQQRRRS